MNIGKCWKAAIFEGVCGVRCVVCFMGVSYGYYFLGDLISRTVYILEVE